MYFHIQHLTNIKATLKTNKYLSSIIKNEEIIQKMQMFGLIVFIG